MELTIDKEFESLLPALKPEELNYLDESLERDGCLAPIIVWANHDDTILDGHNRYRICKSNGYKFATKAITLPDRLACKIWMRKHALGNRNLTEEEQAYERGQLYEDQKKADNSRPGNSNAKRGGHSDHRDIEPEKTAQKLAKELGVGEATIRRDAKFAKAVDTVARVIPEAKAEILKGKKESGLTKKDVVEIAELEPEEIPAAIEKRKSGSTEKQKPFDMQSFLNRASDVIHKLSRECPSECLPAFTKLLRTLAKEISSEES